MAWSSTDARVRRPWIAAAAALVVAVLLAPVGGWGGCPAGGPAGRCVERTRLLVGPDVPASWHAPLLVVGALAAGAAARLLLTAAARRAARRERRRPGRRAGGTGRAGAGVAAARGDGRTA